MMHDINKLMAEAHNLTEADLFQASIQWPMKTKFYTHSSKDDNYDTADRLGLTKEQADNFRGTGYEVEFDIEIDETGMVMATHVNGVALVKPVSI